MKSLIPLLAIAFAAASLAVPPASQPASQSLPLPGDGLLLNLSTSEKTFGEALLELRETAKMCIEVPRVWNGGSDGPDKSAAKRVRFPRAKMTLWDAFTHIARQAAEEDGSVAVTITHRQSGPTPFAGRVYPSKAFIVFATRIQRIADYERRPEDLEQFYLHLTVIGDPDVKVIEVPEVVVPDEAVDSAKLSLIPAKVRAAATRPAPRPEYGHPDWLLETRVKLTRPETPGDRIAVVRGKIPIGVVSRMQVLSLAAPGKTSATVDGITMRLSHRNDGTMARLEAGFTWKESDKEKSRRIDNLVSASQLRLRDAKGNDFAVDISGGGWAPGRRSLSASASTEIQNITVGPPREARLEVPLETKPLEIPFEFKDLPMP